MILKGTMCAVLLLLTCSFPVLAQAPAGVSPALPANSAPPQPAPTAMAPLAAAPGPEPEPLEKTEPQLPNSPSYRVLSSHDKFAAFVHRTYSPYTFASVLVNATYSQIVGDWPTYGGGMQGYGKRFGATLANTEAAGLFRVWLLPTLFDEDPRYYPSGKRGLVPRAWYAGTRVLVGRTDDGRNTFNWSEILGTVITASLTNAYYPRRDRGFTDTVSRSFGGVSSDAASNVLREFWPDIKRVFVKHEPERLKRMQDRLPMETIDKLTNPTPPEAPPMPPAETAETAPAAAAPPKAGPMVAPR